MVDLYVAMVPYIVQFDENVVCTCVAPMSAVAKAESGWLVAPTLRGRDFDRVHTISCQQGLFKALSHRRFQHSLSLRLDLYGLTHINYWHLASGASATGGRAVNLLGVLRFVPRSVCVKHCLDGTNWNRICMVRPLSCLRARFR
ncbi:hypothetical protein [Paraburkholderia terrae]|uniref:hypothetical protein n=1 Tax=Paraburkholderia terrae TaxID=311230 RepID=UPI001E6499DD|nr:hypothetical protein [Paraburkholderia terrae]